MPRKLRFRMADKDDLSSRADFSFEIMQSLSKSIQEAVEASPEVTELKPRAKVQVSIAGSLRALDITIQVLPKGENEITKEELAQARAKIGVLIQETVKSKMTDVLQTAVNGARSRM